MTLYQQHEKQDQSHKITQKLTEFVGDRTSLWTAFVTRRVGTADYAFVVADIAGNGNSDS